MVKKLAFSSLILLVFAVVSGGPFAAEGKTIQSLAIGVKQDPGGGFTDADLNGRSWFRRLGFHNFEENDAEAETCHGYTDFDGNGLWEGQVTCFSSDGTTESTPFNGTYSTHPDGSFTTSFGSSTDSGHISSDGNFAISSGGFVDHDDTHQGLNMAVMEPDNPFGLSDLNGTWQFRNLELYDLEEIDADAIACTGAIVVNNPNWAVNFNCVDHHGYPRSLSHSGTYTLSGNNFNFFVTGDPAVLFSANLSRDGNILIFTRGNASGDEIGMFLSIALRKTTNTFANADLSGTYFFHELVFEDFGTDDRKAIVNVSTVTINGNGNWAGTTQYFLSDGVSGSVDVSGTYSVDSDGSFTLVETSHTPGSTLFGNISGDHQTIILSALQRASSGGYHTVSGLWLKAVLKVPNFPVTLVWKEVGTDTTPSGDRIVSGYFYADPQDFAYGSPYNPEVFVKIYIATNGWCNIAFNHVTVDDVDVFSAHDYDGGPDQEGVIKLSDRLEEHEYTGVE